MSTTTSTSDLTAEAVAAAALPRRFGALYVVLAGVAPELMGSKLFGDMSVGFAGGVGLILLTWAITFLYMRRSDRVWGPLEERIRAELARETEDRFTRDPERVTARVPR